RNDQESNEDLAELGAESATTATPPGVIIKMFDQVAESFDDTLIGMLNYQAPAFLADGIAPLLASANVDILDLGCGTGLVGAQVRRLARTLTGVDLSPNMLDQARKRQIYDQLICADVTEFLETHANSFDAVVAGDLFIYIGDLSKVFQGVASALRTGG